MLRSVSLNPSPNFYPPPPADTITACAPPGPPLSPPVLYLGLISHPIPPRCLLVDSIVLL